MCRENGMATVGGHGSMDVEGEQGATSFGFMRDSFTDGSSGCRMFAGPIQPGANVSFDKTRRVSRRQIATCPLKVSNIKCELHKCDTSYMRERTERRRPRADRRF